MIWLITGVALWSGIHFIPTLAQPLRKSLIERLGEGRYSLVFSLVVVTSIVLMVIGWRATSPVVIYSLPQWTRPVGVVLMWMALFMFVAARSPSLIKRVTRHPQLMSMVVWGISHLLTNGTTRSLVLFGGLAAWALIEIPLINKRDGVSSPKPAAGILSDLKIAAIASVLFIILLFAHPYISGVPIIPR